jgi:prepilin-type N-terminal cleavage/methylation domain-containing protein
MKLNRNKRGFSLIELSIVLIIIGLLIAGVTGGASLIKNSELRSVITEARSWSVAVNSFYNQFDALPGDYGVAIGTGIAGDGDGKIEYCVGSCGIASTTNNSESRSAWLMMKAAGIVDSTIIGSNTLVAVTTAPVISGTANNIPASKIKSAGWDFDYNTTSGHNVVVLMGTPAVAAGTTNTLVNGTSIAAGALTPTDTLAVDAKVDDGVATTGNVRGITSTTGTCQASGVYSTTLTAKNCVVSYRVDVNS